MNRKPKTVTVFFKKRVEDRDQQRRLALRFLCGCANMSRDKPENVTQTAEVRGAASMEDAHQLWWQLQWEKIAAAAEATGPAQQSAILDALWPRSISAV